MTMWINNMESAPRDGTLVLLHISRCSSKDPELKIMTYEHRYAMAGYLKMHKVWVDFYTSVHIQDEYVFQCWVARKWLPLPELTPPGVSA